MGRPLFTITSGNSWIIQWAPVDYVVSKTLGPPLGEEDRRRGGMKTCLKVKEFNRRGSYPFMKSLRSREGVSISVSLLLRKVVPHRHCHKLEMHNSTVKLAKWRQPCLCNTSTRVITLLLLQQNKIHGFNLRDTNHVFGNKHTLFPWKFLILNKTVRIISPAVQWSEKAGFGQPFRA